MKLLVFGATGGTGQQLVLQGLEQGHAVTAFVRRPEALASLLGSREGLTVVQGDVLDAAAVAGAVAGQEVVLSALGQTPAAKDLSVLPQGTTHILAAMRQAGLRRFLCVSSYGVGDSKYQLGTVARFLIVSVILKRAIAEKEVQERVIMESDLDWIIARPGGLTDGPHTGVYRCFTGTEPKIGRPVISRADVADFLLKHLSGSEYLRQAVGLTY
jgi:putative NADH-flavin reductase